MMKLLTCCMLVLLISTTASAQDPVPTVVRLPELPECGSDEAESGDMCRVKLPKCGSAEASVIGGECRCPAGSLTCLSRPEVDKVNGALADFKRCKDGLAECRDKTPLPPVSDGWEPATVILVSVGIGLVVLTVGTGLGYGLAKLEASGRI